MKTYPPVQFFESLQLILVVEDDPIIRGLLCEIMEDEGFSTTAMENAECALEFLFNKSNRVCLLLTDINMPGSIDGADSQTRRVVMTIYTDSRYFWIRINSYRRHSTVCGIFY